jgi:hypothetical protein
MYIVADGTGTIVAPQTFADIYIKYHLTRDVVEW